MGTFHYSKSFRARRVMSCGYPVILLVALLVYWLALVLPSKGSVVVFEFKWWVPLFAIGLVIWFIYELSRAIKDFKFSVTVSDDSIRVGEMSRPWSEIRRAQFKRAFGRDAAIILYDNTNKRIEIPASIESLAYIKGVIEAHVEEVSQPEN